MSGSTENVSGDPISTPLRVNFDRRLKLQFHGTKWSSDGGLLMHFELDETLGLSEMALLELLDSRTGKNARHNLFAMFRELQLAEIAVPRELWAEMLATIAGLKAKARTP